ncbi:Homoserine dehydrogenase [Gemmata sp. SH-PL17]|uniref:homoserine dehydrogenase n=1 Tax=Gemmata sp. SH-PL17 TaxID=1630693 RepID=UPI00078C0C07|nr:homoserine dehydrogenase [Gemmata sp. SH-PL17]AMV29821.1 Homoserine dehydrogenase [Gemmata sp. SH-PL17]
MSDTINIALIGCGTVGGGVARVLLANADRVTQRAGRPIALRRVVVRDPSKARDPLIPREIISTDIDAAVRDPNIHVIVELIGGTGLAKKIVLDSLAAGKHVVTANKALLADAGAEVFEAARKAERTVCFEAAVAGGVPVIRALGESLAANQVTAIQAILNGTSNFILTSMTEHNMSYAAALAEAQRLGYAEADPTLDVDGSDAAHKLAILAQISFGVAAKPHEIARQGIDTIDAMDIRFANELGYTIKLLAEAWTSEETRTGTRPAGGIDTTLSGSGIHPAPGPRQTTVEKAVALHVAPVLLRHTDLLAQVRGAYNAVLVYGDVVGETLYQGPGAGQMPTASSVVADLIDLGVGRAQRTFAAAKLWSREGRGFTVEPPERVRSRFYLRLQVADKPGVLADITRILADEEISISSLVQHEAQEDGASSPVPLVIVTHYAATGRFRRALERINKLGTIAAPAVFFSMGD